jgi:hypothetical protein
MAVGCGLCVADRMHKLYHRLIMEMSGCLDGDERTN